MASLILFILDRNWDLGYGPLGWSPILREGFFLVEVTCIMICDTARGEGTKQRGDLKTRRIVFAVNFSLTQSVSSRRLEDDGLLGWIPSGSIDFFGSHEGKICCWDVTKPYTMVPNM